MTGNLRADIEALRAKDEQIERLTNSLASANDTTSRQINRACDAEDEIARLRAILAAHPAEESVTVADVNRLLKVDLMNVRSFRADVRIDFDEYGHILDAAVLNPAHLTDEVSS